MYFLYTKYILYINIIIGILYFIYIYINFFNLIGYFYIFLNNYIIFSFSFIFLTLFAIIFNYDNILIIFFLIELSLFGCISNFIIFSIFTMNFNGFIYVLLLLVISVSEICIGLAIIIRLSKFKGSIKNSHLNKMTL